MAPHLTTAWQAPGMSDGQSFLDRLPPAAAERFLALGRQRTLRAGAALVLEGDAAGRVWLVEDGLVKVASSHAHGREPIVALRGQGELIGELGAFDGAPRSATVTAIVPTTAREFSGDDLRSELRRDPDAAFALMARLADRLREATARHVSQVGDGVAGRLAQTLLDLARAHGHPAPDGVGLQLDLPLTQEDLAGLVAASRDAVAKTLQTWRAQGLVTTGRRSINVIDPDTLAQRYIV